MIALRMNAVVTPRLPASDGHRERQTDCHSQGDLLPMRSHIRRASIHCLGHGLRHRRHNVPEGYYLRRIRFERRMDHIASGEYPDEQVREHLGGPTILKLEFTEVPVRHALQARIENVREALERDTDTPPRSAGSEMETDVRDHAIDLQIHGRQGTNIPGKKTGKLNHLRRGCDCVVTEPCNNRKTLGKTVGRSQVREPPTRSALQLQGFI